MGALAIAAMFALGCGSDDRKSAAQTGGTANTNTTVGGQGGTGSDAGDPTDGGSADDAGSHAGQPPEPCTANSDNTFGLRAPSEFQYLSGHGDDDAVPWEFYCESAVSYNRNCAGTSTSGTWSTIPVPSNWELQGFGTYHYGTDNNFNRGAQEIGHYRLSFNVPSAWSDRLVSIVFEGSMTDTSVAVNGAIAGATHQGAFYCFQYDIGDLLRYGDSNLLEVQVAKESTNASVNNAERSADYWVFGGIFRPVYLVSYPKQHIGRVAVDARASGSLSVDVELTGISASASITGQVLDSQSQPVGPQLSASISSGDTGAKLSGTIAGVQPWSAETPSLYRLELTLENGGQSVHQVAQNFGFRTVEVRAGDGVYVNDKRVMLRGLNRHSFYPSSGRALNAKLSNDDVKLLKGMNANAVRSSHYPSDRHFLDAADSLGLYVLDELAGWQHAYDTAAGTPLVREMVSFDANHPSIIFWDNGNEWGWNTALDATFGQWDPQQRAVLHPKSTFSNVNAAHYPNYAALQSNLAGADVFLPTEFLHGLYDGGGGASLDDYWTLMQSSPRCSGGFLWAFLDECVVRSDQQNILDCKGNQAPDGIVGPRREREGSYDTIREIWSPVQVSAKVFPTEFTVENRYDFTDIDSFVFRWQLLDFDFKSPSSGHQVAAEGTATTSSIVPGAQGSLNLSLPADWASHHALLLGAESASGQTVAQWSWPIVTPAAMRQKVVASTGGPAVAIDQSQAGIITATAGGLAYTFSATTGLLTGVSRNGSDISLRNGPVFTSGSGTARTAQNGILNSFEVAADGNDCVITVTYAGNPQQLLWRVMSTGWLALTYRYELTGSFDFFGMNFDYPESQIKSVQWLGKGPSRVWKNRMKGTLYDVWTREYSNGVPGASWDYPEFKGYFANVYWARLNTNTESVIHLVFDSNDLFLRLFTQTDGALPQTASMVFPPATSPNSTPGISILQGIPAIGNKFDAASALGPQGAPYSLNGSLFEATLYLFVGDLTNLPTPQ